MTEAEGEAVRADFPVLVQLTSGQVSLTTNPSKEARPSHGVCVVELRSSEMLCYAVMPSEGVMCIEEQRHMYSVSTPADLHLAQERSLRKKEHMSQVARCAFLKVHSSFTSTYIPAWSIE